VPADEGKAARKDELKEQIVILEEALWPLKSGNYGPPRSVSVFQKYYIHQLKKLRLEHDILKLEGILPGSQFRIKAASGPQVEDAPTRAEAAAEKNFARARRGLDSKRRQLRDLTSKDEEFSQQLKNTPPPRLITRELDPSYISLQAPTPSRNMVPRSVSRMGNTNQGVSTSTDPLVNADDLRAEFLAKAGTLLLKDLPNDGVRETFSREKGFRLTAELLESASTWNKLSQLCRELRDSLTICAAGLPAGRREEWIENQLTSLEAHLLPNVDTLDRRTIGDNACLLLLTRWGIDTTDARRMLFEKITQAFDMARFCANKKLQGHSIGRSVESRTQTKSKEEDLLPEEELHPSDNSQGTPEIDASEARSRAVAKVIKELTVLRPQIFSADDYPKIREHYPRYLTIQVCERHPDLKLKLESIQGHQQFKMFAKEIVARHFSREYSTVEKDWKKHKPDRKPRKKN